ncbi:Holliday junction resolvase RuvX [Candidatus Saccharibacteria bacterium]|nr:Holliday junction resolvase RuvX [Candidatus Saccharibacteria bacterium]
MNKSGVVIGLDIGARRIGVARGDLEVRIATPLPALTNDETIFANICQLVEKNHAEIIVIGLPRDAKGQETAQSQISRNFATELANHLAIKICLEDESLTSVLAEKNLRARKNFQVSMLRDGALDSEAATIILQDFLDNQREVEI